MGFQQLMAFSKSLQPHDQDYHIGYQRGLRRAHHRDNFGTAAEHQQWLNCEERHPDRYLGYRDGLAGTHPRSVDD